MSPEGAQAAGLTLTTVGTVGAVFSQMLPPSYALAGKDPTPETVGYVSRRATQAVAVVAALAGGAALLTRSPWPLVGGGAVAVILWCQYVEAARLDTGALT